MELWAAIDILGGSVVTLVRGRAEERTVWEGSALEFAARWGDGGADGIHVIDLDAALGTGSNRELVAGVVRGSRVPVQVGGGIRSRRAAEEWLDAGAHRVVLGTMAFSDPAAARELLGSRGAERLVVAADYRDGLIVTGGWKERRGIDVLQGARGLEAAGFRNLLVTAVGRDGTGSGPDLATVERLSSATTMRVTASGGIRNAEDIRLLGEAGASGAVIGRALYEGKVDLAEAKRRAV
jgi:phosphoribosylformimino-5-aminoimidazole carboxamide ribotide isomerase